MLHHFLFFQGIYVYVYACVSVLLTNVCCSPLEPIIFSLCTYSSFHSGWTWQRGGPDDVWAPGAPWSHDPALNQWRNMYLCVLGLQTHYVDMSNSKWAWMFSQLKQTAPFKIDFGHINSFAWFAGTQTTKNIIKKKSPTGDKNCLMWQSHSAIKQKALKPQSQAGKKLCAAPLSLLWLYTALFQCQIASLLTWVSFT